MNLKPIKSEADYQNALKRMEEIFHAPMDIKEGEEAKIVIKLIDDYENEHYPIGA